MEFPVGSTTATVTIPVMDDLNIEDKEVFSMVLQNPSLGSVAAMFTSAVASIADNDGMTDNRIVMLTCKA